MNSASNDGKENIRQCRSGDTVCSVRPQDGSGYLHTIPDTPKAVAYANYLISVGRWRVCRCGDCGAAVEECLCVWS